jgi:hypothetical protein
LRARYGLPSFRQQRVHKIFADVLRAQRRRRYKDEFRVVHFSIQRDHLHLVVEADTERAASAGYNALRSGISGLAIAFARRLNKLLSRKGQVWADRYHRRDLKTPKEVSVGYLYIFGNYTHHGEWSYGDGVLDIHSSAWVFEGWVLPREPPPTDLLPLLPVCRAQTWLASKGYLKHGRLSIHPSHP